MKKLIFLLLPFFVLVFTSCNNDDDDGTPSDEPVNITLTVAFDKITRVVTFSGQVTGSPDGVFYESSVNGNILDQKQLDINSDGTFSTSVNVHPDYAPDGSTVIAIVEAYNGNTVVASAEKQIVLEYEDDMGNGDPGNQTVELLNLEHSYDGTTINLGINYQNNSLLDGQIAATLFRNSTVVGEETTLLLPFEEGLTEWSYNLANLTGEYRVRIRNTDPSNPIYGFPDINGDPQDQIIFDFTIEVNQNDTASIQGLSVINITSNSATVIGTLTRNCTDCTVRMDVTGNGVTNSENLNLPNNTDDYPIEEVLNGLNMSIDYLVEFFLNDAQTPFEFIEFQTSSPGQVVFAFGNVTNVTSNSGTVGWIYTNQGNSLVTVEVEFSSSTNTETTFVEMSPGSVQVQDSFTTIGYKQVETVIYSARINGEIVDSGSFMTLANNYTAEFNLVNGGIVVSGQTTMQVGDFTVTSTGDDQFERFDLQLDTLPVGWDPNGYIDNVQIGNSLPISISWEETSTGSGIWLAGIIQGGVFVTGFPHQEEILNGSNTYGIYIGAEVFVPSGGAGTTDMVTLTVKGTDGVGTVVTASNTLTFTE
ncbi:hypothetical protein KC866_02200 [Patescibacteria group bacterium]|nr:hypothetical protein [Patescibacteria group bacterium]